MRDLSVLIPARNEIWLNRTIQDVLSHMEADTEIIVVLDGAWPAEPIPDDPRVILLYHPHSVGQRAAVNEAARMSNAKYIMKLDAHCSVDQGFDVKLMEDCEPDWTVIPRMYNLHVFDWQCQECGERTYQGGKPEKCGQCGCPNVQRFMLWEPRWKRVTDFARFDNTLHFQYWTEYRKRPQADGDIADVMCFVGASFFMERQHFLYMGGLDERHGSWGQMGVEISCKSWLSGGRMVVNKKTWFAHLFRTQPGFGFPYPLSGSAQEEARTYSRWLWNLENPSQLPRWVGAQYPLRMLIDKFAPVPDWEKTLA